ncbi:MAG: hypothetical protein FWE86_02945 [Oscillospiraceae bacterium]|nr:hypothetical protein [Oscillospiraceae bacterium]
MFKLFKSTTAMCFVGILLGVLLVAFLEWEPLVFIVWILACLWLPNRVANKKLDKIIDIMQMECNLQKYIEIYERFLRKWFWRVGFYKKIELFLLLNLSYGYLGIGDKEKAWDVLSKIMTFPDTRWGTKKSPDPRWGAEGKVVYNNNLAAYYLRVNDTENAAKALEGMKAALENKNLSCANRDKYFITYCDKQFSLNMVNGNYDGCEQFFNLVFEWGKTTLGKTAAKYNLGKIYLHYDRPEEAKAAFQYAADNGGDSRFAVGAKEFLNDM